MSFANTWYSFTMISRTFNKIIAYSDKLYFLLLQLLILKSSDNNLVLISGWIFNWKVFLLKILIHTQWKWVYLKFTLTIKFVIVIWKELLSNVYLNDKFRSIILNFTIIESLTIEFL